MKWTVVWQSSADNRLADLWNNGPDRTAITQAANRIEQLLKRDPIHVGEGREDDVRILIEQPIAVYYTVSELDFMVPFLDVWRWTDAPSN
jgi:hypothetical protein